MGDWSLLLIKSLIVVVVECSSVKQSEEDDRIEPEDSKAKSLSSTKGNFFSTKQSNHRDANQR
jgi:hypothetical protein